MKLLLPLFCLLSPAFGPVSAQDKGPVDVVTVAEGADALLPCALSSGNSVDQFDWSKNSGGEEKEEVFFYDKGSYYGHGRSEQYQSQQFRGRVVFLKERLESGDASITIQNTRLEDNGTYTCVLFKPQRHEVNVRLNVGAAPLPHIYQIPENNKIFLECKAHGVPKPELEWRDSSGTALPAENGRLMEREDTSGRFHMELRVNVTRSDNYTCVVTQKDIYHQIKNTLIAHFEGAAQLPHIQMLDDGITWRFLSCLTKGVPEPEVQWRNSAGQVLAKHVPKDTDGHSQVELKLNVTKSDTFTCVVTQWEIHHQINNSIKVMIPETFPVWQITAACLAVGLIVAFAVIAGLSIQKCNKAQINGPSQHMSSLTPVYTGGQRCT